MELLIQIILLIIGFILLIKGADVFVDGASNVAYNLKIPTIIVGLTIVAFGTSAPEAAVSITSAFAGTNAISLGNVVGSNIFNILAVIGISALIGTLTVDKILIKRDFPEVRCKLWKEMFWSRSYCLLTTGGAPIGTIRKYIENQGR